MDACFVKIATSLGWFAEFSFALERNVLDTVMLSICMLCACSHDKW